MKASEFEALSNYEKSMREADKKWDEIKKSEANLLKNIAEAEAAKKVLNQEIAVVRRQLDFIDNLLRDPQVVERIESYDPIFSPGNQKNLVKLAKNMRQSIVNPNFQTVI